MSTIGYNTPDHFVSLAKKLKPDWYKNTCNYYIGLALSNKDTSVLEREMNAFHGIIDKKDYHFILNPYNFNEDRLKNLPGRLRNYDLISPIWRRYMGEYSKGTNNFSAIAVNPDVENSFENGLMEMVNGHLRQMAANSLNAAGIDSGVASKEVPNLADTVKQHKQTLKEARADLAQERLDALKYLVDDESIRLRCYSDWINYSEFYTYRDIQNDDVFKEAVPIEEYYPIDNGKDFVEDHDAGVRITKMTIPEVITYFGDRLTNEEIKYLRDLANKFNGGSGSTTVTATFIKDLENIESVGVNDSSIDPQMAYHFCDDQGFVEVAHVVYKTQVQIKILNYINPLGEERQVEVGIKYKLDEASGDIKLDTAYRVRVYEQYRLGGEHAGIYTKPEEIAVQRTDINNNNVCKLPYNGRRRLFAGFPPHGIIKTLLPYQIFINILNLSRERAIAKNHGKIMTIPESFVMGDSKLTDNEKIYFMLADGKLYLDDSNPNFATAVQALKSVETGDAQYILGLGQLIEETKLAAQEDVDMNRQRFGETLASDGKYTTQQALIRSSLGSVIINDLFNKTFEKDYQADMDYSKVAWLDGKKGYYLNSDRQVAFFDINGVEHAETSYGIFATNNSIEQEKIDQLKDLAFSAAQNGDLLTAAESVNATSSSKLKDIIARYQEMQQTRAENAQKSAQDGAMQVEQVKSQTEQAKLQSAERIAKYQGQIDLRLKEMDILITRLKIASEEEKASVEAELENKKLELQNFIDSQESTVEEDQKMLGLR